MKKLTLSASTLGVFEDCALCFWMDKNRKSPRPRGIFPSLPGGVDAKLKGLYDELRVHRKKPFELCGPETEGYELFHDVGLLNKWRNWRSGLQVEFPQYTLIGALDDLLFNIETGLYMPLDYKTKGKPTTIEDVTKYYQRQLDIYTLMLQGNGYKVADHGIIISYYPDTEHLAKEFGVNSNLMDPSSKAIIFKANIFKINVDPVRAKILLEKAFKCLSSEIPPPRNPECEYCNFVAGRL